MSIFLAGSRKWAFTATASAALVACAGAASPAGAATSGHGQHAVLSFWRATPASCPPAKPGRAVRQGAIVAGPHDDCVRLGRRVMTVDHVTAAVAERQQGGTGWEVELTFTRSQQREFRRITTAAVGHLLAMVDNDGLITAPTVQEPLTSRRLDVVGLTKARAQRLARSLTH